MASLYTGNYEMSQNCMDDSKEYFFVKLTDSAYRAIEEYQKNQIKFSSHATIQIVGNGGFLSFPTTNGNVGQKFNFSVDDVDGSIECIEQNQNQLDVLGTLPYKMRIHANDDVYETTRYRMAVAEETQKNKCTREIKPNQTDIGRKVKVKTTNPNINNVNNSRPSNALPIRDLHTSSRSPSTSGKSPSPVIVGSGHSNGGSHNSNSSGSNINSSIPQPLTKSSTNNLYCSTNNMPTTASSLSSALSSAAGSGTSGINNGYFSSNKEAILTNSNDINTVDIRKGTSVVTSNSTGNTRAQKIDNSKHKPDISKRKIRERLIHLLALKPFKRPELYSRLQNEGINERERKLVNTILKEISIMRDNTYNLKRPIWNDVIEDWPFYTEQDIQMLKRRKPQNLTPLSSDGGSSTSGQSPTSTHTGSPTPAVKRPTHDRDRDRSFCEDSMSKKQRISHFKKDNLGNNVTSVNNVTSGNTISANVINNNKISNPESDESSVDLSYGILENDFMAGGGEATLNSKTNNHQMSNKQMMMKNCNNNNKSPYANNNDKMLTTRKPQPQSPSTNYKNNNHHITTNDTGLGGSNCSSIHFISGSSERDDYNNVHINNNRQKPTSSPNIGRAGAMMQNCAIYNNSPPNNDVAMQQIPQPDPADSPTATQQMANSYVDHRLRNSNHNERIINVQCSSGVNNNGGDGGGEADGDDVDVGLTHDFSNFTKIVSIEQRRLYKTEFEKDFVEYKKLLQKIDSVGKRFQKLAEQLAILPQHTDNYRDVKTQIVSEYKRVQGQEEHRRAKERFEFLHAKLAHIKGLVNDYDTTLTSAQGMVLAQHHQQNQSSSGMGNSDRNTYFNIDDSLGAGNYSAATATNNHHMANGGNY